MFYPFYLAIAGMNSTATSSVQLPDGNGHHHTSFINQTPATMLPFVSARQEPYSP